MFAVMVNLAKMNGPITWLRIKPHQTLILGLSLSFSTTSQGFSDSNIKMLCLLTFPNT